MTETAKKKKIKALVKKMLKQSQKEMVEKIDKALSCGALNLEEWDENYPNPMILPKVIVVAIMEDEAHQYTATGTRFEKEVKKEVKNLKIFL